MIMSLNQSGWTCHCWQRSASLSEMLWVLLCLLSTVWVSRAVVCPCERPELCQQIRSVRDFEVGLMLAPIIISHSSFITECLH